jgi:hypothetical protein
VIPVLLLLGLLCGRWSLIAVAAVAWPLVLLVDGACPLECAPGAAAFAAANTAVGVLVHKGVVWPLKLVIEAWRNERRRGVSRD